MTNVIGARLEGHSPERQLLAAQTAHKFLLNLLPEMSALILVHLMHAGVQFAIKSNFFAHAHNRKRVLWKTTSAVAKAGIQKLISNAAVGAHALAHIVNVGAVALAQIRDLIDETNFARKHCVAGVLHHFRTANIHNKNRIALAHKRLVQLAQYFAGVLAFHAAHHAVGLHEVANRVAFFQKLGIVGNMKRNLGAGANGVAHLMTGAHRHGALDHDHFAIGGGADLFKLFGNVLGHGQHILQVGASVLAAGRAHANENDISMVVRSGLVRGELNTFGGNILGQHLAQTGFVNRALAAAQHVNLLLVNIQAQHVVASVGKASAGDQSNISSADHGEFH